MKTKEQVVQRLADTRDSDFLGFQFEVLVEFIDPDDAREFCVDGADLGALPVRDLSEPVIVELMRDYMEFAWEKVAGHRGISAERSVIKMGEWLWLLDDEGLIATTDYAMYGAPILFAICQKYGFPVPDSPEVERMIQGLPCREGCGGCC